MGSIRTTAAAVLTLIVAVGSAYGQCVSEVQQIASGEKLTGVVTGPTAWGGGILAVGTSEVRDQSIAVNLYDEYGHLLFEPRRFSTTEDAQILDVLWDGSEFGVFYLNSDHRLVLRRVTTTAIASTPVVLQKIEAFDPTDEIDIIWSSLLDSYVVARTDNGPSPEVSLILVSRTGSVSRSSEASTLAAEDSFVRVAITDSGVIAAFYEQPSTRTVGRLRIQGDVASVRTVWTPGEDLVVTTLGEDYALARTEVQIDGRRAIRWKLIDFRGQDVRDEARLLVGSGQDVQVLSLRAVNSELALTYLDAPDGLTVGETTFRLHRFRPNGVTISNTYVAAADDRRSRTTAKTENELEWTGSAYVSVAVREREEGDLSYFIRFCPLAAQISASRVVPRGSTVTLTGTASGGVVPYAYLWTWGTASRATTSTLQQTFDTVGTFTYSLKVTDESGAIATETFEVTVYEPSRPRRRAVRK
jgi:hypothetical protein